MKGALTAVLLAELAGVWVFALGSLTTIRDWKRDWLLPVLLIVLLLAWSALLASHLLD